MNSTLSMKFNSLTALFMIPVLCLAMMPAMGCTASQKATVINEINVVLTETTQILAVAEPGASWVPQLQTAVTALKTAEANWNTGGAVADVISALNTIEAITAVIPATAAYSPLIDVLVAGVEVVLAALPATETVSVKMVRNQHVINAQKLIPEMKPTLLEKVTLHPYSNAFKRVWNETCKKDSHLMLMKIK